MYNILSSKDVWLSDSIGRSLHLIPKTKTVSFGDKSSSKKWVIRDVRVTDRPGVGAEPIAETLPNREDLTWTNDGRIVMSDGEKLFYCEPDKSKEWKLIEVNSGSFPLKGISRLAINTSGDKIAIVMNE